jgi:membrane associated rhomboid family serine protease
MMINKKAKCTKCIIGICVFAFISVNVISPELIVYLYYDNSSKLNFWTYATHMFMHGSILHLLFNMVTFLSFGQQMEIFLGRNKFLQLYFFSGIASVATWIAFNFNGDGLLVGASGAICGVVAAFAIVHPRHKVLLFFIIPIRSKTLIQALVPISLALWLFEIGPQIAHMAHAGGAVAGYVFMKWERKRSLRGRKRPSDSEEFYLKW